MEGRCYYPFTLEDCYCASPPAIPNPPPELRGYRWVCVKVTASGCSAPKENVPDRCPAIAPDVGQPCSLEAEVECHYPFTISDDGWCPCSIRCVSGRWLLQEYGGCPG
jgi:hypothetical protein